MRKLFIAARGAAVSRVAHDTTKNKRAYQDYDPVVSANVPACTRINALAVLVRSLEQLDEKNIVETEKEPTVIYTIDMVLQVANGGAFKHWLLNDGKKFDGEEVNADEMELWKKFMELYTRNFSHVILKRIADVKSEEDIKSMENYNKNPRTKKKLVITDEMIADSASASKVWERVEALAPAKQEAEEIEGEAI